MGYSTDFKGVLRFTKEPDRKVLAALANEILGEWIHSWPWSEFPKGAYHVDLELTDEFDGIQWNGMEKTYGMLEVVQWLCGIVLPAFDPELSLEGTFVCQGEDIEDRWILSVKDGKAERIKQSLSREVVECPECNQRVMMPYSEDLKLMSREILRSVACHDSMTENEDFAKAVDRAYEIVKDDGI